MSKQKKLKIFIILLMIIGFVGGVLYNYYQDRTSSDVKDEEEVLLKKKADNDKKESKDTKNVKYSVDIKGAVKVPGVYQVEDDKRVMDVVLLAGGLSDNADTTYVNLAKKVSDAMAIVIYTKDQIADAKKKETFSIVNEEVCICPVISNDACINDEDDTSSKKSSTGSNTSSKTSELININTASVDDLQTLSGIGESKAEAIITYREENGNFEKIEDIKNVSGIGDALYEKIKDSITV